MKSIVTSIAAGSLLAALAIAQPPHYTVTDLGTLGGASGAAYGINNAGRVAGAANLPNGDQHAFLSGIGGTKYDLGTLGGPNSEASGTERERQRWRFLPRLPRRIRWATTFAVSALTSYASRPSGMGP